jgi:putative tricarboxylic transport membrane protein
MEAYALVGPILGPVAESQLRRALQISPGDPWALVRSPIAAVLFVITAVALVAPFVMQGFGRFNADED